MDFKQVDKARKVLGLNEYADIGEIKDAFRKLSLKYHPDRCQKKDKKRCGEIFKEITNAKDIILSYCGNYRYSFREKDVKKNILSNEEYQHIKRFYDGWFGDLDL
jgi:DnaJ-class molecular chaperone